MVQLTHFHAFSQHIIRLRNSPSYCCLVSANLNVENCLKKSLSTFLKTLLSTGNNFAKNIGTDNRRKLSKSTSFSMFQNHRQCFKRRQQNRFAQFLHNEVYTDLVNLEILSNLNVFPLLQSQPLFEFNVGPYAETAIVAGRSPGFDAHYFTFISVSQ